MSLGTLYTSPSVRVRSIKIIADYLGLDIDLLENTDPSFEKRFPLKKVPAFITADDKVALHEVTAIAIYLINEAPDSKNLLGDGSKLQYAEVLKWISFVNSDYLAQLFQSFAPLAGRIPYQKKQHDAALATLASFNDKVYESYLKDHTYLVGERVTFADFFTAALFTRGFSYVWGKAWREQYPAITRWFKTITQLPAFKNVFGEIEYLEEPVAPPKGESKKKETKKEVKKETKKEEKPEQAEEKPAAEPAKPKHPLEALGKAQSFPLDEWKRVYSNKETREEALPWFWEHYDPKEYSLWKVAFKYNDELTLTFMSNNLIGGFFNRLSASVKYLFGAAVVYGENNNNGIIGAFVVRGDNHEPAFDVAPDWESYEFTKLDSTKEADREFVNDLWAWDKPVVINGDKFEIADGKVLK
ncbi:eEF1-gamma domain-containing protein [Nadsonia fulvescens var. elongata DSM 6958]|uniref:EEF1-gamma domain-containing protein n=1 Tax=Nadsonia fulvescens var. elongata DSM 6958 TaxID=857566 RepID=A0A1E3PSD9_9ASCO|nr:eEF1-gamma domain-containing protein [Nadsonia fulvescens var. elongata DSM 6958]